MHIFLCFMHTFSQLIIFRNCNLRFWFVFQFPITAIREIKILKKLHHQNVIQLKEIVTSPGSYLISSIIPFCLQGLLINYPPIMKYQSPPSYSGMEKAKWWEQKLRWEFSKMGSSWKMFANLNYSVSGCMFDVSTDNGCEPFKL
jgi:serine/threonine protein kinase